MQQTRTVGRRRRGFRIAPAWRCIVCAKWFETPIFVSRVLVREAWWFHGRRVDRLTCGARCRQILKRAGSTARLPLRPERVPTAREIEWTAALDRLLLKRTQKADRKWQAWQARIAVSLADAERPRVTAPA